MTSTQSPDRRPPRRPTIVEAAALDASIRDAAIDTFIKFGFDGTTMDAVARAAGITRNTLYARYPDKRAMFVSVVHDALRNPPEDLAAPIDRDDLRAALLTVAQSAYGRAVDERSVRLGVLLMSEAPRFPDLIPKEHHLTRLPHMQLVSELLHHHIASGNISVLDVDVAAEQFLTMVVSHPARLASFGLRRTDEFRDRYLSHAVELFLHGVDRTERTGSR